jgi:hypothetical protein
MAWQPVSLLCLTMMCLTMMCLTMMWTLRLPW